VDPAVLQEPQPPARRLSPDPLPAFQNA